MFTILVCFNFNVLQCFGMRALFGFLQLKVAPFTKPSHTMCLGGRGMCQSELTIICIYVYSKQIAMIKFPFGR